MPIAKRLWPREHGAYAELAFPLVTGLALAGPTLTGASMAIAAALLFLAHEPLAVVSGARGARRQLSTGTAAFRRLVVLAAAALLCGTYGMLLGGSEVRNAVLVPLVPAIGVVPWVLRGRQKTLPAELLIVAAFAGCTLPLVVAGGGSWRVGSTAAGIWCVSFGLGTLAVHGLKLHHKRRAGATRLRAAVLGCGGLVTAVATYAVVGGHAPVLAAAALLPPVAVTATVALVPIHPRRLKLVGWSLVSANTVTLGCLVLM